MQRAAAGAAKILGSLPFWPPPPPPPPPAPPSLAEDIVAYVQRHYTLLCFTLLLAVAISRAHRGRRAPPFPDRLGIADIARLIRLNGIARFLNDRRAALGDVFTVRIPPLLGPATTMITNVEHVLAISPLHDKLHMKIMMPEPAPDSPPYGPPD